MRRDLPITLACALAGGCDAVDSTDVTTAEIRLSVDIEVDESGAAGAVAHLTTDNDALLEETFVRLAAGDQLWISVGGEAQPMVEEHVALLNIYQYAARLDGIDGGDRIEVAFTRDSGEDAPRSRVVVPDEFSITAPSESFSRRDGIDIAWSRAAAAERSTLLASGSCFESISERFDGNPGRAELSSRDFVDTTNATSCEAAFEVRLGNDASVDPHYGRGGTICAHQVRVMQMIALP